MVAHFLSHVESARFNEKNDTVVLLDPNRTDELDDLLRLSKAQLRNRLEHLQSRLQRAEETIHLMHDQVQMLSNKTQVAPDQSAKKRIPEPARQSSTYIVPNRQRSQRLDRATRSIPFYLLMTLLGIGLAFTTSLAISITSVQLGLPPLLMLLLKGVFVAITISTIGSFALEVSKYHAH